jgi:hypothetical protein
MPIQAIPRGAGSPATSSDRAPVNLVNLVNHQHFSLHNLTGRKPAMIDSVFDIAAIGYPGPEISFTDADLADWIEQQQTVPLSDDDYPHQSPWRSP